MQHITNVTCYPQLFSSSFKTLWAPITTYFQVFNQDFQVDHEMAMVFQFETGKHALSRS